MRIHLRHSNLWGEQQQREMDILYQSNNMMITQYTIDNAQQPLYMEGACVLENGYTVISFIEYGKWYIIDKIFDFQASPTGYLTKLVTPVEENMTFLATMDLFVRLWITRDNQFRLFGTKMFKKVSEEGLLSDSIGKRARETMDDLVSKIQEGMFPPEIIKKFTIENKM